MKSYSNDLKSSVISYYNRNSTSFRNVANIFGIGKSSVERWIKRTSEPGKSIRVKKTDKINKWITKFLKKEPWSCLKTIVNQIWERWKIKISKSTLSRFLKKSGLTYKQMRKQTTTNKNTPEEKEKFRRKIREIGYDNVLSLDEVGFQLDMITKRGWSKKGKRCIYSTNRRGHLNFSGTFIISNKGVEKWWLSDKSINTDIFLGYVKELSNLNKFLVMDNLRVHHNKEILEEITQRNITPIFTLPYSPELNPIEEVFSWLKRELRKMLIKSKSELVSNIEKLVVEINKRGLNNYYKHSYDP